MRVLIDTHILIWALAREQKKLSSSELELIENTENQVFTSMASLWEIGIKNSIGRLSLQGSLNNFFELILKTDIEILPISEPDIVQMSKLPFHHSDPFDRLIIAQAMVHGLTVISKDSVFPKYDVKLL